MASGTFFCSDYSALTLLNAAGDWQSDSLLHRLCTLQKKTALVILHKEILEFAERCVSTVCTVGLRSIPTTVVRLTITGLRPLVVHSANANAAHFNLYLDCSCGCLDVDTIVRGEEAPRKKKICARYLLFFPCWLCVVLTARLGAIFDGHFSGAKISKKGARKRWRLCGSAWKM